MGISKDHDGENAWCTRGIFILVFDSAVNCSLFVYWACSSVWFVAPFVCVVLRFTWKDSIHKQTHKPLEFRLSRRNDSF